LACQEREGNKEGPSVPLKLARLREESPDNHLLSFKSIGDRERFGLNMAAMRNKVALATC
jgi:hypothetical protein